MRLASLSFALGVLLLQAQPRLPDWPWGLLLLLSGAGVLAAAWQTRVADARRRALGLTALVTLLAVLGFSWAGWRADDALSRQLAAADEGRDFVVTGIVTRMPQAMSWGVRFELEVEQMDGAGLLGKEPGPAVMPRRLSLGWWEARRADSLAGRDARSTPELHSGERWRMTVRLKRPHGLRNPGGFDAEAWMVERGIDASGAVRLVPVRLSAFVARPDTVIERLREMARDRFLAVLPRPDYPWGGILAALAVGDQQAVDSGQWRVFARTGTTHLMSISGLHVTLVAGLVAALAGALWRRHPRAPLLLATPRAAALAGMAAALVYTLLAGAGVPALRTLIMVAVAGLAVVCGRATRVSRVLAAALMAVLVLDPWAVLVPGFWLSYGAVGALLYVGGGRVELARDEEGGTTRTWRGRVRLALARFGLAQWTATLATLPLVLFFFQQFSLVSPLANAVAIPVISFVVTPLALLAALLPVDSLLWLAHAVLSPLMALLVWLADLPLAVWSPPAPPIWSMALAVAGLLLLLAPRGLPGRLAGALLLLPLVTWPVPRPGEGEAWVTVLDVGQGLAVVVRTAGHVLAYDTGPAWGETDAGERVVAPYLRTLGVGRLDALVVTHSDRDHSGGALSVLQAFPTAWLVDTLPVAHPAHAFGVPRNLCEHGLAWEWDGVRFTVLHPPREAVAPGIKPNRQSCVMTVDAAGRRLLLAADLEIPDEAAVLRRGGTELRADVLVAPHHGGASASSPAFVGAVRPDQVVFSAGYRNRFAHPRSEVVERYREIGSTVWRTDRDGAVTFRLGADGVSGSSERQDRPHYWAARQEMSGMPR